MRPMSITRTIANRVDHDDHADHDRVDLHRTVQTRRGRTHDRGPIKSRSSRDHTSFVEQSSPVDRQAIDKGLGQRSWPDRRPIVARSWPNRGGNCGDLEAKLKRWPSPIRPGIEATIHAQGIAPSTSSNRLHDHLNCPRFGAQFPL